MRNPDSSGLMRLALVLGAAGVAAGCIPARPGNPPQAPVLIDGAFNARVIPPVAGSPPTVVAFGTTPWQSDPPPRGNDANWALTHRFGWRNDVLVQNPHALQLRIGHRLGTDSLEVRDGQSMRVPFQPARVNQSFPCVAATPTTPTTPESGDCWPAPGDQRYRNPPVLASGQMHASYELLNSCDGLPTPALNNPQQDRSRVCNAGQAADAAAILTISPPTAATLVHGQVFDVSLVATQGSGSQRLEAVTPLKLVHVVPGRCRVSLTATPAHPQAVGSTVVLAWTSTGCARLVRTANGAVTEEQMIDPAGGIADAPLSGTTTVTVTNAIVGHRVVGSDALAVSGPASRAYAAVGPAQRPPAGGVLGTGGTGTGGTGSSTPDGPCAGGTPETAHQFTMTCFAGGTAASWTVGTSACSIAEARTELQSIYWWDIQRGCVLR